MTQLPADIAYRLEHVHPGEHADEIHGAADVAASLAGLVFESSKLDQARDELAASLAGPHSPLRGTGLEPAELVSLINSLVRAAVAEGARLGFAYARKRKIDRHGEGWQAWTDAALDYRARSGCGPDQHTAQLVGRLTDLTERVRALPRREQEEQ